MAQFEVQVTDDQGNVIYKKNVEATDYIDACEEVARQARGGGSATNSTVPTGGPPSAGTAPTSTGSTLDGPDKLDRGFKLG